MKGTLKERGITELDSKTFSRILDEKNKVKAFNNLIETNIREEEEKLLYAVLSDKIISIGEGLFDEYEVVWREGKGKKHLENLVSILKKLVFWKKKFGPMEINFYLKIVSRLFRIENSVEIKYMGLDLVLDYIKFQPVNEKIVFWFSNGINLLPFLDDKKTIQFPYFKASEIESYPKVFFLTSNSSSKEDSAKLLDYLMTSLEKESNIDYWFGLLVQYHFINFFPSVFKKYNKDDNDLKDFGFKICPVEILITIVSKLNDWKKSRTIMNWWISSPLLVDLLEEIIVQTTSLPTKFITSIIRARDIGHDYLMKPSIPPSSWRMYLSCISNLLNIEIPINYYEPVCRSVFQIFHEFVSPPLCDSLDLETWYFIQSSTLTNFLNFYAMYEKNNDSLIRELLDILFFCWVRSPKIDKDAWRDFFFRKTGPLLSKIFLEEWRKPLLQIAYIYRTVQFPGAPSTIILSSKAKQKRIYKSDLDYKLIKRMKSNFLFDSGKVEIPPIVKFEQDPRYQYFPTDIQYLKSVLSCLFYGFQNEKWFNEFPSQIVDIINELFQVIPLEDLFFAEHISILLTASSWFLFAPKNFKIVDAIFTTLSKYVNSIQSLKLNLMGLTFYYAELFDTEIQMQVTSAMVFDDPQMLHSTIQFNNLKPKHQQSFLQLVLTSGKYKILDYLLKNYNDSIRLLGINLVDTVLENENFDLLAVLLLNKYTSDHFNAITKIDFSNSNTNLNHISIILASFTNLEEVNLSNLKLHSLPLELTLLPKLKKLIISNNPLTSIPLKIVTNHEATGDISQIISYLNGLIKQGVSNWKEVKLVFVGEEKVGKSSLIECFQNPRNRIEKHNGMATDGIDMSTWAPQDDLKFRCWDFGGQAIFLRTQELFISSRSIYFVVFKLSENRKLRIEYWLKKIKYLTQDKPLIYLVGTHHDEIKSVELQKQAEEQIIDITLRFTKGAGYNIVNFFPVSCRTGDGIKELKADVIQNALSSNIFPKVPSSYLQLITIIEREIELKTFDVNWEKFCSWAEICSIAKEDVVNIAQFLHDTGIIVHFHVSEGNLQDLIILQPQMLAQVITCLISFTCKWKNGIVSWSDLKSAWKKYNPEILGQLLILLIKFELIFPVEKEKYLIPSLLSEPIPPNFMELWTKSNLSYFFIWRQYLPQFVPIGLFPRLLIRFLIHFNHYDISIWKDCVTIQKVNRFSSQTNKQKPNVLIENNSINNENLQSSSPSLRTKTSRPQIDSPSSSHQSLLRKEEALVYLDPDTFKLKIQVRVPFENVETQTLFSEIVSIVDTLFSTSYSKEIYSNLEKLAFCPFCITNYLFYRSQKYLHPIPLSKCLSYVSQGKLLYTCDAFHKVRLDMLTPDLSLIPAPVISNGNIQIVSELGRGAFGIVYKGLLDNKKEVALKELKFDEESQEEREAKFLLFLKEVKIMSFLDHPNLVKLYGITSNPSRIVLEYVKGGDIFSNFHFKNEKLYNLKVKLMKEQIQLKLLKEQAYSKPELATSILHSLGEKEIALNEQIDELIQKQAKIDQEFIPWILKAQVCLDVAKGMKYLHKITPPIIHRDLRSSNIFLVSMEIQAPIHAKVGDFGMSNFVVGKLEDQLESWQWLAPEVFAGCGYDEKSDLYSFGIFMWEISAGAGQIPFLEFKFNTLDVKRKILEEDLRPTIPSYCSSEWTSIIQKCFDKNPQSRPSWSEIIKFLKQFIYEEVKKKNLLEHKV